MFRRFRSNKTGKKDRAETQSVLVGKHLSTHSKTELFPPSQEPSLAVSKLAASDLGLHVVHQPESTSLDIIFVHGLGGHRQRTWSENHDPALFWPGLWLPYEPGIGEARILTFGYNANWRGATKSVSGIGDFAKELLFEMRFAKDHSGTDLHIGTHPIIFVVHSMGGLVVKKACLLGTHDRNYQHIIRSISAIMFMSTPHRGTNLAATLNYILAASFQSSKAFISDLDRGSSTIEDLNEQFRHLAPSLSIWSFYETLATSIGPKKIMVLEKDSSVLGYPDEISRPLQADHHGVCKYSNPTDPSYISVRNALTFLIKQSRSVATQETDPGSAENTTSTEELLRGSPNCDADYNALRRCWVPDTCAWFIEEPGIPSWIESSPESRIIWYNAPPGNGKSVLAAFMINYLRSLSLECHFFLFKYSDHSKRSVAGSFLSLACQLAKISPQFKRRLDGLSPESLELGSSDPLLIWRNVFEHILFEMTLSKPIYWIIDALDECNSPETFLECLKSLSGAKLPVRILILSRNTNSISIHIDRLSHVIPVQRIDKTTQTHYKQDIELFVRRELEHMRGSRQFREQLMQNIMIRSKGNFLWTRLVLEEIMGCHTEQSIREALEDIPDDMTQLYQRMEQSLLGSTRKSNKFLIQTLLGWCICAQRPLDLKELSQALQPEFSGFLDIRKTIQDVCGQFIQVDDCGKTDILHHTAREYFTRSSESQFHIDTERTHEKLLMKSLVTLEEPKLRWRLVQNQHALQSSEPFIFYAAINWPFHLEHSDLTDSEMLEPLLRFFRSPAVLVWIHVLALLRQLETLIKASKTLMSFVHSMRERSASHNPIQLCLSDLEFLDNWVVDLAKLVGKFAHNLIAEPGIVYDVVPALCPTKSVMYQQFCGLTKIKTSGAADGGWDDNLCRLSLPGDDQASEIACVGKYLAVVSFTGTVHIWDASNFAEVVIISHGEPVTAMALNGNGAKLSTYGTKSTKLWSIPSGKLLSSVGNPPYTKARAMAFAEDEHKLLVGGDDNIVRYVACDDFHQGWQTLHPNLLKDTARVDGTVVNSPLWITFNSNQTLVGVSYRGAPLSVWRLHDGRCINKCKRAKDFRKDQLQHHPNWFAVIRFTWNPVTDHVLGIYKDGCVFKWHPVTDENVESSGPADEIAASPNGKLFVTSSPDGSVRVWDFANFKVIYQLSSESLVTRLSFSPDSRRFYDLRDGYVNAWESNSLTRFIETEEHFKGCEFEEQPSPEETPQFLEERTAHFEAVTAFAVAPDSSYYCVGYEDGTVTLFQRGSSEGVEFAQFHNFLPVVHIRWSADGKCVAVADLAGHIQLKTLSSNVEGVEVSSLPSPQINLNSHNIEEMVFGPGSQSLLISTGVEAFVYSIESRLQASAVLKHGSGRKWICHPTRTDVVLGCGTLDIQAYSWKNLENLCSSSYQLDQLSILDSTHSLAINKTFCTQDAQHIILHMTMTASFNMVSKRLIIIPITDFQAPDDVTPLPPSLRSLQIPHEIFSLVNVPIGVLPGSRLAFLDHDLWLCTYFLEAASRPSISDAYHRFYFLPRDWVGRSSFEYCELTKDGSFFWPKEDRVMLIECDLHDARLASLF
ncbi:hypothetical protein F4779DRAFT_160175 [Xylariaceae sp. FL0662B]|nr:hypothetical protein F4779DRAFT_160175 [Xylariaceae sp. FL0662B]